jgi:hypothetical protein
MHVPATPLTLFGLVVVLLAQPAQLTPAQAAATQTVPWHPCARITAVHGRRQDGFWDGSGLYSADYVRDAATEGGHEGLAANRHGGRGGMQEAESEFWKGWPS